MPIHFPEDYNDVMFNLNRGSLSVFHDRSLTDQDFIPMQYDTPINNWNLLPGSDIPREIPLGNGVSGDGQLEDTEPRPYPIDDDGNPIVVTAIPSRDEARNIVQEMYLRFLGRQPDDSGWNFWTDGFINQIQNVGTPFDDAIGNLVSAFLASTEYRDSLINPSDDEPQTLTDLYNGLFKGSNTPSSGGGTGGFTIVPQEVAAESGGSSSTQLIIILAIVGIAATFLIHRYYLKHRG